MRKSVEDGQTLAELSSAHKPVAFYDTLLSQLSRYVWDLDLARVYRPPCVRSVLTTSVEILPYRPPARLIRANLMSTTIFFAGTFCLSSGLAKVSRRTPL